MGPNDGQGPPAYQYHLLPVAVRGGYEDAELLFGEPRITESMGKEDLLGLIIKNPKKQV